MRLVFILLLAALGCSSCVSQAQTVVVSPLASVYGRETPVALVLRNDAHESVRVYCNLEVLDEYGEWVNWPFRIEDGRAGAVSKIYSLKPGGSASISFDITRVTLPPIPPGKAARIADALKFRFRVIVMQARTERKMEEIFTAPFVVQRPYGRAATNRPDNGH